MTEKISNKDKKDWENFLSENNPLPNKDLDKAEKKRIKSKHYDFHGFSLSEANETINKCIKDAYENGVRKLVIVTGKGIHSDNEKNPYSSKDLGILKYSMPEYIKSNLDLMKLINEIKDADIEDGGSGAFYIFLKKKKIIYNNDNLVGLISQKWKYLGKTLFELINFYFRFKRKY